MKIDLKKTLKDLYSSSAKFPVFVDVPEMNYLMVDGTGDPNNSESYTHAVEALYSMSYSAKFRIKKSALAVDFGVMPLEGLWWTEDPADFSMTNRKPWKWTAMIMQPEWVTREVIDSDREKVEKKLQRSLADIRFETFDEGRAAQIMHIGPYSDEPPTIAALHRFINDHSLTLGGKHHEVYLSDPRRGKPERLKTILRQPVC